MFLYWLEVRRGGFHHLGERVKHWYIHVWKSTPFTKVNCSCTNLKYSLNRVFSGLVADHYSNTSLFSLAFTIITSSGTILMTSVNGLLTIWLEGFLYGKLCVLTCTLAKEVQLFSGLGLYSGIFAIYLQCPSKRSGTALILFYAVCLLYVLSAATFVSDLVAVILQVSNNNSICKKYQFLSVVQTIFGTLPLQLQIDSGPMLLRLSIVQTIANGCCDFLGQCILVRINHCTCHPFYWPKYPKIYRCWIVWGQDIRVVIIPSFLAVAYLGQSSYL